MEIQLLGPEQQPDAAARPRAAPGFADALAGLLAHVGAGQTVGKTAALDGTEPRTSRQEPVTAVPDFYGLMMILARLRAGIGVGTRDETAGEAESRGAAGETETGATATTPRGLGIAGPAVVGSVIVLSRSDSSTDGATADGDVVELAELSRNEPAPAAVAATAVRPARVSLTGPDVITRAQSFVAQPAGERTTAPPWSPAPSLASQPLATGSDRPGVGSPASGIDPSIPPPQPSAGGGADAITPPAAEQTDTSQDRGTSRSTGAPDQRVALGRLASELTPGLDARPPADVASADDAAPAAVDLGSGRARLGQLMARPAPPPTDPGARAIARGEQPPPQSHPLLAPPPGPAPAEPVGTSPALMSSIVSEIAGRLRSRGGSHRMTVQLEPPELGTVRVELTASRTDVRVVMRAQSPEAVGALGAQRAEIGEALAREGFALDSFDVRAEQQERQWDGRDRRRSASPPDLTEADDPALPDGELRL